MKLLHFLSSVGVFSCPVRNRPACRPTPSLQHWTCRAMTQTTARTALTVHTPAAVPPIMVPRSTSRPGLARGRRGTQGLWAVTAAACHRKWVCALPQRRLQTAWMQSWMKCSGRTSCWRTCWLHGRVSLLNGVRSRHDKMGPTAPESYLCDGFVFLACYICNVYSWMGGARNHLWHCQDPANWAGWPSCSVVIGCYEQEKIHFG